MHNATIIFNLICHVKLNCDIQTCKKTLNRKNVKKTSCVSQKPSLNWNQLISLVTISRFHFATAGNVATQRRKF